MALISVKRSAIALAFFVCSSPVFAAGWGALGGEGAKVESAKPVQTQTLSVSASVQQPVSTSTQNVSSEAFSRSQALLLSQIEQLQQEILMLRGTLEEQAHKIKMLEKTSDARYLDLDGRVSQLVTGSSALVASSAGNASVANASVNSTSAGASATVVSVEDDTGAYKAAFALVRAQDYDKAAPAFVAFQKNHPQSPLLANSWYWLGEVYLIQEQLEPAKHAFTQVVDLFSGHRKEPDARYKLAVVYDRLGDKEKARVILTQLIETFSESGSRVVGLAQEYLKSI